MKINLSKLPFTCVKTENFYTGKASKKLAFATILFLVTWNYSFGQYQIDYSKNYDTIVREWRAVCDSLYEVNLQNGDTSYHGTGYSKFLRWKNEWEVYMPSSGNFQDAMNIKTKVMEDKRLEHLLNSSDSTNQTNSLQVPAVDWIEIGPKEYSSIHNENTGINPHVQTPQANVFFGGHVGKFENIYQHPTKSDTLYACAGGYDVGGGGLFRSKNYGETWEILGTDKIPDPKIYTLAIKPSGQNPSPSQEILFIGVATGAVYRSTDDGENWYEAGYNGTVNYPFVNGSVNPSQSLPYSFDYVNFIGAQNVELQEVEYTGKSHSLSDQYGRLVVCRTGGLFYSDNSDASISINTANQTLTNNIVWNKFNTDNIINQIESDPIISTTQVKDYIFTDFTSFRDENDQLVYAANLHFIEFDENLSDAINTNKVRQ